MSLLQEQEHIEIELLMPE